LAVFGYFEQEEVVNSNKTPPNAGNEWLSIGKCEIVCTGGQPINKYGSG
jgi:hypothetical protein